MGFSNYVYRNSHSTVKKRMNKLREIVDFSLTTVQTISADFDKVKEPVKTVIFSDSIILISKDKSVHSLDIILYLSQIVLLEFLKNRIPVKGAISYGMLTADFGKSLFFGKAFIDAYKLQDELYMYGIVLDHKVEKRLTKEVKFKDIYCTQKAVPTKTGMITHFSLNWALWSAMVTNHDDTKDLAENVAKNSDSALLIIEEFYKDISGHPRKYIDNTRDFLKKAST